MPTARREPCRRTCRRLRTSWGTSGEVAEEQEPIVFHHVNAHFSSVHVSSLSFFNSDDIRNMIDEAKRKAASANRTASDTMDKVSAIKQEVDKIGIVAPGDSNLNNVLNDVDQSSEIEELLLASVLLVICFLTRLFLLFAVKNLLQSVPTLENKISEMENLTSEFSQMNNITGNIKKIKELIEQARDAANRVSLRPQGAPIWLVWDLLLLIFVSFLQISIPMKFSGTGHVELRAPKNLEDLKAYTSMSLSLQRPDGRGDGRRRRRQNQQSADMFVLYLGSRDVSEPSQLPDQN